MLRLRSLGNRFVVVPSAARFNRAVSPEPTPTRDWVDVHNHVHGRRPLLHIPEGDRLDLESPSTRGDDILHRLAVLVEFFPRKPCDLLRLRIGQSPRVAFRDSAHAPILSTSSAG